MKNFIKAIKKLNPKEKDILVITFTGYPNGQEIDNFKSILKGMKLNTNVLLLDERVRVVCKNEDKGKHLVYLSNLEYLEYLANHGRKESL